MSSILVILVTMPFAVAVASFFIPTKAAKIITIAAGSVAFMLSLALVPSAASRPQIVAGSLLRVDALSVVFLVATTFLYATTAVFASGYLSLSNNDAGKRYGRRFYAGLNLFCWSMTAAPLVNGLALLWVAIEITTVISALLVAIDDTDEATEASWKYVLIASLGLGIALLATIIMYYAGTAVFGSSYELSFTKLLSGAGKFPADVVRLAFVLAVLGYGTKMGLAPVHTWLPDAHSEAPTPVSALLSGALLAISFYAILRYFQIAIRSIGPTFPRDVLLIFGVASLVLASLYLLAQRDIKRLLAYSSVEHMGILAIGMSFAAPIAIVGVLLHVLAHAAAKGTAFFGAGSVVRKFATKDMRKIRGGVDLLPWSGPMFVAAILALSAMPPFGIFRSEFLIVAGGLQNPGDIATVVLVMLVTMAFFGLSWFATQTMLSPKDTSIAPGPSGVASLVKGEVSIYIVISMGIGLVALVILGVHPPEVLLRLLNQAAAELGRPR